MCDIKTWLLDPIKWTQNHVRLLQLESQNLKSVTLNDIMTNSDNFIIKPEITSVSCKSLLNAVSKDVLDRNIQSAYPLIHEAAFFLCAEFLLFKIAHGSAVEKQLYENMTLVEFIQRLLDKRAMCFCGPLDMYMLRDGSSDYNNNWEYIGTSREVKPLILQDYLSYDELKLSALLSVSSYSYFVNDGRRLNGGELDSRETLQDEGVVVGLIGPRMQKRDVMEYQETISTEPSKIQLILDWCNFMKGPDTLQLFFDFYQETRQPHADKKLDTSGRFVEIKYGMIFDNAVYRKRLAVSFDTLLIEANHRAKQANKSAYVHVVGIGLGVWRVTNHQMDVYLDTFGERIKALGQNLANISTIDFSYFKEDGSCLGYGNDTIFPIENHPQGGVKIIFSKRQPNAKLEEDHKDELLVVSYAWDSNALPGNEFWQGSKGLSSDGATAASCQISELHNPYINPVVTAQNLRIATPNGIVTVSEYLNTALNNLM